MRSGDDDIRMKGMTPNEVKGERKGVNSQEDLKRKKCYWDRGAITEG